MSFPRYPNYKDSGVEWLGEVPEHWDILPLKKSFRIVGGSTPKSENESFWDGDILWATPSDLSKRDSVYIDDTQRKITAEGLASCGTTLVPAASIILSTRAPIGSLAIAETAMCTNQGCKSLIPSELAKTEYFAHLLSISSAELNIRGKGTTFLELSGDELGAFKTPAPPLAEQTQIAAFLDRETGKIDALIAEQRRLVELLAEKRQAVISHAVTQGLNPHAPMKPSGIEWLGDVPKHWNYGPLKYLATIKTGYAFSSDDFVGEGIPVLRIGDITTEGNVDFTDARCLPAEYEAEHSDVLVVRSDIVMAMTGATIGKAGWYASDRPALLNQRVCIFRVVAPNAQRYLWHILSARFYTEHIALAAVGGAQPNISDSQLLQCAVPLPPESEQTDIASFLDRETAKFDALTTETQRAIDLLQERRTALISAAVTGQIDVRRLP